MSTLSEKIAASEAEVQSKASLKAKTKRDNKGRYTKKSETTKST
tara:strand:+ start:23 stop:154 length:132 start_codon:yes stop_codon:yes gene_type:complete